MGMIKLPTKVWCMHLCTILIGVALIGAFVRLIIMWRGTCSDGAVMVRQGDTTQVGSCEGSPLCLKSRQ